MKMHHHYGPHLTEHDFISTKEGRKALKAAHKKDAKKRQRAKNQGKWKHQH